MFNIVIVVIIIIIINIIIIIKNNVCVDLNSYDSYSDQAHLVQHNTGSLCIKLSIAAPYTKQYWMQKKEIFQWR